MAELDIKVNLIGRARYKGKFKIKSKNLTFFEKVKEIYFHSQFPNPVWPTKHFECNVEIYFSKMFFVTKYNVHLYNILEWIYKNFIQSINIEMNKIFSGIEWTWVWYVLVLQKG